MDTSSIGLWLKEIEDSVDRISAKWSVLMATIQDFRDAITQIDAETNRIAKVISDLITQLQGGGLTAAEETEAFTKIQAAADALKLVGATQPQP